jgi:hypothetical protein
MTDLERLEKSFSLTMIAFIWYYKIGYYLDEKIQKIKKHDRRAVSIFKIWIRLLVKIYFNRV